MKDQAGDPEKLPWLKFWVGDWLNEHNLRFCSRAARSVWIDMLCVMHRSKEYGHLSHNGKPLATSVLCDLIGGNPAEIDPLIRELEDNKVFSRTADGVIFSRRMVRDQRIRSVRKATGKLGGNPALKKRGKKKG